MSAGKKELWCSWCGRPVTPDKLKKFGCCTAKCAREFRRECPREAEEILATQSWCAWCGKEIEDGVTPTAHGCCSRPCEIDYCDDIGVEDYSAILAGLGFGEEADTFAIVRIGRASPGTRPVKKNGAFKDLVVKALSDGEPKSMLEVKEEVYRIRGISSETVKLATRKDARRKGTVHYVVKDQEVTPEIAFVRSAVAGVTNALGALVREGRVQVVEGPGKRFRAA